MPRVVFFRSSDGHTPFLEWLQDLPDKANVQCLARVWHLAQYGHELRRPIVDYLRDGIYELRVKSDLVQYRILYFFHGKTAVVVSHGLVKQRRDVPGIEIDRAILRKRTFEANPDGHTYEARKEDE